MAADYSRMPEEGEGLRAATDHGRVRETAEGTSARRPGQSMVLNAPLDPIRRNPAHVQGVGGFSQRSPHFQAWLCLASDLMFGQSVFFTE